MDLSSSAASVGALADPIRRRLYEYVVAQPDAVGRDAAASALELARHTVSFHLDKLVDAGLLVAEHRRLSGRAGPGAGRPSKLYRRASEEVSVSLPSRSYDLVARILATGIERSQSSGTTMDQALADAATDEGRSLGASTPTGDTTTFVATLSGQGYEPRMEDGTVVLANCPFDTLARTHTELVCGLNRAFVQGVADGMGCVDLHARLEPEPQQCCVKVGQSA